MNSAYFTPSLRTHLPYCRYFVTNLVTLLAISAITLGTLRYVGSALNTLGTEANLAIMCGAICALVTATVVLLKNKGFSALSHAESKKYRKYLKNREYFIYKSNGAQSEQKMIYVKLTNRNYISMDLHNSMRKHFKEVSLLQLKIRSLRMFV